MRTWAGHTANFPAAMSPPAEKARGLSDVAWVLGLFWLAALIVLQSVFFRLHMPYDQTPDQDLVVVYNALLLNSGQRQEYFDHPGYLLFLVLAGWFRALGWLGLLPASKLTALPRLTDIAGYETAWQGLIEAARAFSAAVNVAGAVMMAVLAARLFNDRRIGLLAGLALATGMGAIAQLGIVRTEPVSAFCTIAALMLTLVAASGGWHRARFVLIGLAGFAAALAVLTKVFAIVPLAAVPPLAILFGAPARADRSETAMPRRAVLLAAMAVLAAIPAGFLVFTGFIHLGEEQYKYHPIGGGIFSLFTFYQGWLVVWIGGCVALYARIWRVPLADAVAAAAALTIGISLGLAVLFVRYELLNVIAVTHPIEQLFVFSTWTDPSLDTQANVIGRPLLTKLIGLVGAVVAGHLADPGRDNMLLLELAVIASVAGGIWFRDRLWALQAMVLLLISWGLQTVFLLRYTQLSYHVYSDPFTVLAGVVVLARFRRVLLDGVGLAVVVPLTVALALWGLSYGSSWNPPRDWRSFCLSAPHYLHQLEIFPFCPLGPDR